MRPAIFSSACAVALVICALHAPDAVAQDSVSAAMFTKLHQRNRGLAITPKTLAQTLGVNPSTVKEVGQLTSAKRWKLNTADGMRISMTLHRVSGSFKDLTILSDEVKKAELRISLQRVAPRTGVVLVCTPDVGVHTRVRLAGKISALGSVARHTNPRFNKTFFPVRNVKGAPASMELLIQPASRYANNKPVSKLPQGSLCRVFTYSLPRLIQAPVARPGR